MLFKVFIVDDIGVLCDVIIELLLVVNIKVDVVIGGKEVVVKMCVVVGNSVFYDVFILDWNMFDIDGLEVVVIMK